MTAPAPGSPEWRRLMSASKVAAVLGVSPYQSPWSLWMEMTGRAAPEPESEEMRRGHLLEPAVLAWWESRHSAKVVEMHTQWTSRLEDWGIATLDALAVIGEPSAVRDVVVEAKTTTSWDEWGDAGTDAVPGHYYAQVLWQLACTPHATRAFVAVLGPWLDFREYVIERDDALIADLIARCRAFYESLSLDAPPPLDGHTATLATLRRMHPDVERGLVAEISTELAAEYVAVELDVARVTERARATKVAVLAAAGRAQYIETPDGARVARRQASGRGVALRRVATEPPTQTGAAA